MIPSEKLTRDDKYLLAFDALVLSGIVGTAPACGKIIHGSEFRVLRVKLTGLLKAARSIVEKIAQQQASDEPPQLTARVTVPA